jgi:putative ABC transport system ATP-binding protein
MEGGGRHPDFGLAVTDLAKRFQGRLVLNDVSFTAEGGELVAVTGPSGCGKTTLLNCLGALDAPDGGRIVISPKDAPEPGSEQPGLGQAARAILGRPIEVTDMSSRQTRRFFRHVAGFVFQNSGLVDSWTVYRNLRVPVTPAGKSSTKEQITEALGRVGAAGLSKAMVYTLSGGEQQRVALARLLLKDPLLVLADEPMAALDPDNAEVVLELLRGLADRGALVLMASHDPDTVARCDREVTLPHLASHGGAGAAAAPLRVFGITVPRLRKPAPETATAADGQTGQADEPESEDAK